jgi:U4/U6 small nuclear ribonucleoprotein PRP3
MTVDAENVASEQLPGEQPPRKRKKRWGEVKKETATDAPSPAAATPAMDPKAKVLAMQESIRARLAAAKSKATLGASVPALKRPAVDVEDPPSNKRAKHFELDLSQTAPTFTTEVGDAQKAASLQNKPKVKVNPYLAHQTADDENDAVAHAAVMDPSLARAAKLRPRHKELSFVEPGFYQELAVKKRQLAQKAQVSGYVSGRKTGHTIHSASLSASTSKTNDTSAYVGSAQDDEQLLLPRADCHPDTRMPLTMEWWDAELLPAKLKKQVAAAEAQRLTKQSKAQMTSLNSSVNNEDDGKRDDADSTADAQAAAAALFDSCFEQASLMNSKTSALVQHIVPIHPPNYIESNQPPVLHLTKKELKRQRKLRRQAKQRELQDLQAAGLVPAPEPRLTLRNFIQVLGDQAYVDPSHMEQKVTEQMAKREQAHLERNQLNKLTKEQRAEKRARKLQEDTSQQVHVAIFYVQDMSHPYHRAKVDLNAQQNFVSGCVLECEIPKLACVIVEGGPKAIQRYSRLMLVRMKWTGIHEEDDDDDDDEDDSLDSDDGAHVTQKFNPDNKCELVWKGMAVKRLFQGFIFQDCETSDQARKVLKSKGVGHYWDQVLAHARGKGDQGVQFKLLADDGDENFTAYDDKDEDIVMADES